MDNYTVTPYKAEHQDAKTESSHDSTPAQLPGKVVKGGAWVNLHPISVRAANRFMLSPDQMTSWVGFRCGMSVK